MSVLTSKSVLLRRYVPSTIALYAVGVVLFAVPRAVPDSGLPDRALVILEAARVVLGTLLFLYYLGWSVGDFVLPREWQDYEPLLSPLIGIVVLVPLSYFLNYLVSAGEATVLVAVAAVPLAARRLFRGAPLELSRNKLAVPVACAALLILVALIPHLIQASLGVLGGNPDEVFYFYLAKYLQAYAAGGSTPGPFVTILPYLSEVGRAEGYGFQYFLAAASTIGNVDTFDAYVPSMYLVLALGVFGWYVFFREALGLGDSAGKVAIALYSISGLTLWVAAYGYPKQIAWITLTPLAVSALVLVIRRGGPRSVALCGLTIGTMLGIETRVVSMQLAVSVVGLAVYWLVLDRSLLTLRRTGVVAVGAAAVAAPVLTYFVPAFIASERGGGYVGIGDAAQLLTWGPGFSGFPPLQVGLSLEPNELAKIWEPINGLAWLDPLNVAMMAASPLLAYIVVVAAGIGAVVMTRRSPIVVAMAGALVAWIVVMRTAIPSPYGYFKLFGLASPFILGFAVVGGSRLWERGVPSRRISQRATRTAVLLGCVLVAAFFLRNSAYSFLFGARGWGLSIPPSLADTVASFGPATAPGSKVFITNSDSYPVPESWIELRKNHRLAIGSREEASTTWATRMHTLVASSLVGRDIYGEFKPEYEGVQRLLPEDGYDYYVLWSDEDPRLRGLDASDVVVAGQGVTLYRNPRSARATADEILSQRGTLTVDGKSPLVARVGSAGIELGASTGTEGTTEAATTTGRIRVGLMALTDTPVDVTVGGYHLSLLLDPGVNWYTTPTVSLPSTLRVENSGWTSAKVVSLRLLPPGDEGMDRTSDVVLLGETTANQGGVDVEVWLSNPTREMYGTSDPRASVQVPGPPGERKLDLQVPDAASDWLLRFGPKGQFQQLRNGVEAVPTDPYPWLEKGGELSMLFRLGHQRAVKVPLAMAGPGGSDLLRFADPVQVKLWVQGNRATGAVAAPDVAALEGKHITSDRGYEYVVSGGRKHWVPDASASSGAEAGAILLPPEQLWAIPPGLPWSGK